MYLFEQLRSIIDSGFVKKDIPDYIIDNLSDNIKLRDYQKEAIIYTLVYLESELCKNKQTHLLYHMATGSGKTVIMAMDILYYYKKGYRNFMFFTNRTNIVSKTRINFTKKGSLKYLFAENIIIDGKIIDINVVDTFHDSKPDAINICFNTVQGIQSSLNLLHEGRLDISDFEDNDVVLIADEAHHLNSTTASDKKENADNQSWEDTVYKLLLSNKRNVLLEYTATCDLRDENVEKKYLDKIIYNFRLKEFREAGYTKEFSNYTSDSDYWLRTLQALIMSEFRKLMFQKYDVNINPVVLIKSKVIKESNEFYNEFFKKLDRLDESTLISLSNASINNIYLSNAFRFFKSINLTNSMLIDLLKMDFSEEYCVNMNSLNEENENIVNNLDEKDNKYRLIFIVDKLTEGWDVLSLFDIVRLYDTRQGGPKGSVSKYTISEAQLIGRGARYCPFKFEEDQLVDRRKYENLAGTPEVICETLLYHCMRDSKYIDELKRALIETGLTSTDEKIEVSYNLKDSFIKSDTYNYGKIYVNTRIEKSRKDVTCLPSTLRNLIISYDCKSLISHTELLFETENKKKAKRVELDPVQLKDIELSVLYKAYRTYANLLTFDKLKEKFPNLTTIQEFLTSNDYLGKIKIIFQVYENEEPTKEDTFNACVKALDAVASFVSKIEIAYEGTKEFKGYPISEKITSLIRKYSRDRLETHNGVGIPQNDPFVDDKYRYDVTDKNWYVFNNNFGTTEEKAFIKYFATKVNRLLKKFDEVYVLRNEQQVKVYSFENGEAFEPDFILLFKKKQENNNLYFHIFVEPKGNHILEKDSWKGRALLEFTKSAIPVTKFVDDDKYVIWGTPLFNEENTIDEFNEYFEENFMNGNINNA